MRRSLPVLVTLVVLAACGGGGSPGAGGPTAATSDPSETPSPSPSPPPPLPWGPTQDEYDRAAALVAELSTAEQAGQVIVARYAGLEPPLDLVDELHLGGVIMMGDNVESPEQVRAATADLQAAAQRGYPLMIGVDQEGGTVTRVAAPATEFPAYMTLGAAGDPDLAAQAARASGDELRAMGFTLVFAPDADVTTGPDDPTIGTRSASSDPELAATIVAGSIAGYAEAGIVAVAKHFPGHGSVPADSHDELPVQSATAADLAARDFVPFAAAVEAGVPAVMVAHIDVQAVDPGVPSSLSPAVIGLLRDDLGFDGLVVTDAQDMAAIADTYGSGDAAVRSLAAGADVILMPADPRAAHEAIVTAVDDGTLPADRLAEAATRSVALMLHVSAGQPVPEPSVVGTHEDLSYEESLAGLTMVAGVCGEALVDAAVQVVGGTETDRARFADAAEAAGLSVGSGPVVRLLGGGDPGSGDVVVALDRPYALGASSATVAKIALFGRTPAAFRALVDVLRGQATGGGTLPVPVDGVERPGCGG